VKRVARRWASIVWPAFLMAAVLELVVFAWVDPLSLHTLTGESLPLTLSLSPTAIYSLAFLVFWACTAVGCALTVLLERTTDELNTAPTGQP